MQSAMLMILNLISSDASESPEWLDASAWYDVTWSGMTVDQQFHWGVLDQQWCFQETYHIYRRIIVLLW